MTDQHIITTADGMEVLSAHVIAMDCCGNVVFVIRDDGKGADFPGGAPEPEDGQDPINTAYREFAEEVRPAGWSLASHFQVIGRYDLHSVKQPGKTRPIILLSSRYRFVEGSAFCDRGTLPVDTQSPTEETRGCAIRHWGTPHPDLVPYQAECFVQIADQLILNNFPDLLLSDAGKITVRSAISIRNAARALHETSASPAW